LPRAKIGLSAANILATATAFAAYSIVDSYRKFIKGKIDQIIISGGGSFNLTLLEMIKNYCNKLLTDGHINILTQEELGFSSEAKERLTCSYEGDDIEIGFNSRFMQEMLNTLEPERIILELSAPNRAGIIISEKDDDNPEDILMLIMPVMLTQ